MTPVAALHARLAKLTEYDNDIAEHLQRLYELVLATNAQIVVELGPGSGNSTTGLLRGVEETSGRVWSCDVAYCDYIHPEVANHSQWTYVVANDLVAVNECPRPIDFLFIDSEHTYQQTLNEMLAYVPLVRSGGYVAMHDTVVWKQFMLPAIHDYSIERPFVSEEWYQHCNGLFVGQVA